MKKKSFSSPRRLLLQLFPALCFLLVFAGITFFLFSYRRDEKQFAHITAKLFETEMALNTLNMHYTLACPADFGIYEYKPVLPSYDRSNSLRGQAFAENIAAALSSLNQEKLSAEDSYTCRLLLRSLDNSLKAAEFPYYEEPLSPSSGMQSQLPILLAEYTFRTEQDVTDYLALLEQTQDYLASLLTFEQEKAQAGLLMPASSLQKVIEQCDTIVTNEALEAGTHFLQTTFKERLLPLYESGEITEKEAKAYLSQNDRLLMTILLPAYEALADGLFLLEDASIPLTGLGAKPEGAAYYKKLLISETGSYRPIPEIKQLLASRFSQELDAIRTVVTEHPSLAERLSAEGYPSFPYTEASHMLLDLQTRMKGSFPAFSGKQDSLPAVSVKTVSPSLEKYCAPAFYLTAPLDDTDNNVIYINQKNPPSGLELYTTLAHEGYPGHLYQTVYSNRYFLEHQENRARQLLWYGGYQEGWAIYVEFMSFDYASNLLTEQGRPEDAALVQLEKHNRSLQLCLYSLLDIMIHSENASLNQVAELLGKLGITQPSSAEAVYTYIAEEPCNYLKYYLGYLEILELQTAALEKWGDAYSDYAFHTFFLNCGPSDFTSLRERLLEGSPSAEPPSPQK